MARLRRIRISRSKLGIDLLKDGRYVKEDKLKNPKFKADIVKLVPASMKGWKYTVEHPHEAAEIVMDYGGQEENHQKRMWAKSLTDRSRQAL